MATPAEKKALLFLSAVALLGAAVRIWRPSHTTSQGQPPLEMRSDTTGRPAGKRPQKSPAKRQKNARSNPPERRDYPGTIDLDRATLAQIEALGVLKPGVAQLIIEDRETFGPFGSIRGLDRVPYLNRTDILALVPKVTFSLLPRPHNAVLQTRPESTTHTKHRRNSHRGTP